MQKVNIIWFRRDLRLEDNTALYHALRSEVPVLPIFIFDKNILDKLEDKSDRRVAFIHCVLNEMKQLLCRGVGYLLVSDMPCFSRRCVT